MIGLWVGTILKLQRAGWAAKGQVHTERTAHSKSMPTYTKISTYKKRPHQPRTNPNTAQTKQMAQQQHKDKFTPPPETIYTLNMYVYPQNVRTAQIELSTHNTNLSDQDSRPPQDYSNKPHYNCRNTDRSGTSQRTATHQTPCKNKQVFLNLHIQECRIYKQPRNNIEIKRNPTPQAKSSRPRSSKRHPALPTEATERRRSRSGINSRGNPALQSKAAKPSGPRHTNSRPSRPTELPRSAASQQTYPPTGTAKQTWNTPPATHQDRRKGPSKKRQSEYKTRSKGKTYSAGTNIWSPHQTTGSPTATSSTPYRIPQRRSRITKNSNGRNSGPWPLQRWSQPPEPTGFSKKTLWRTRNSHSSSQMSEYTKATLTATHKTSKAKDQLWQTRPGNHQFQKKSTCTSTDRTASTPLDSKNCNQVQPCSKHKRAYSCNTNQRTLPQHTLTHLHLLTLYHHPLLPPLFHHQIVTSLVTESTILETQNRPPQHTQSNFSPPQQNSSPQLQQIVLPLLSQNSIDSIANRTSCRIETEEVVALSSNRDSHSSPPRRKRNKGAPEHNRQGSRVEARCEKESEAGGLSRGGGPHSRTSSTSNECRERGSNNERSRNNNECRERGSHSERSRGEAAETNGSTSNDPPRLSVTFTVTTQPGFYRTITSIRNFTSRSKAYFVSNGQCNDSQMLKGLGPNVACVPEQSAPLVKVKSNTRHRNISNSKHTNKYNKNTEIPLHDVVMLHEYCYVLEVHPNTPLYVKTKYTSVVMNDTLEFKHKTKTPLLKAMLHPAPQIKLWGGEGLKSTRVKHTLKNIPFKKLFSKKLRINTLQLHNTVSQTNSKIVSHKNVQSCKYKKKKKD